MKTGQRLFIDCEFNGFGGELISMAFAGSDGCNWYGVMPAPADIDPWVEQHVMSVLDAFAPDVIASSAGQFRSCLYNYLRRYDRPTIVADWPSDLVHFHQQLLGEAHATTFPYACDTALELTLDARGVVPHNALSDAIALRVAFNDKAAKQPQDGAR